MVDIFGDRSDMFNAPDFWKKPAIGLITGIREWVWRQVNGCERA